MNRVHPTCTERPSLTKECGWKGGDRSGLAHGQELTGRKRRTKTSLQEREKRKNILDTHRPSHGRHQRSRSPVWRHSGVPVRSKYIRQFGEREYGQSIHLSG